MKVAALTHPGLKRPDNQDRHLVSKYDNGSILLVVADGMGGLAGGEVAAQLAVDQMHLLDEKAPQPGMVLLDLVHRAEEVIMARAKQDPDRPEMGTTLTAAFVAEHQAHWIHVGDSRLYHLAHGKLKRVTRDQNLAQLMVDEGELTPGQAQGHPLAGLLDQCVGCGDCRPAFGVFPVASGDLLLLCSDGLHGVISDRKIARVLVSAHGLKKKAKELLDQALGLGAPDNVTVVLAAV